ncbi:MAG: cytochrome c [Candidatus Binatia bacterium]
MIMALGVALGFGGLVMHPLVTVVGAVLAVVGAVGWFREVLPVEHVERVPLAPPARRARPVEPVSRAVAQLVPGEAGHRLRLPVEIHPYSAGVVGGLVGGAAMAMVAGAYGILAHGSPWYPINLLAAVALPALASADAACLAAFDGLAFAVALVSHGLISIFVGLVYAAILPIFRAARRCGGVVAPLVWSGLLWASLGVINPALNNRIDWPWFVASQIAFGLAVGVWVTRTERIRTMQSLPFAARAGIEAPGLSGREGGRVRAPLVGVVALAGLLAACDALPGKPTLAEKPLRPEQVVDFDTLYGQNCAGCHGADGLMGGARPMNDPIYLALAGRDRLVAVTAAGVPGTAMPGFAQAAGGMLTDAQVAIIVDGMLTRWGAPGAGKLTLPPYAAPAPGNAAAGARAFARHCAGCHGADGTGGERGQSVVDGAYLALVSDQALRSAVICGRIDLGMPDWRGGRDGTRLSDEEVTDVVAWLASQRPAIP